jgi:hypothetical protein
LFLADVARASSAQAEQILQLMGFAKILLAMSRVSGTQLAVLVRG